MNSFCFAYPHSGQVSELFMRSFAGLLMHDMTKDPDKRFLVHYPAISPGCYVGMNRGRIVSEFMTTPVASHLLMIDTDIEFRPDILDEFNKILELKPDAHIIAGRVNLLNGLPVFYHLGTNGMRAHATSPFNGIREFDLVGTGIICISRECINALYKRYGHVHFFRHMIKVGREIGDDFSFCIRARKLGFKLYGAWNIVGIHHKTYPVPQKYPELSDIILK